MHRGWSQTTEKWRPSGKGRGQRSARDGQQQLSKFDATLAALKTLDDKDMAALVERGAEQMLTWPEASPPAGRRYIALQKEKHALEVLLFRRQQDTEAVMTQ